MLFTAGIALEEQRLDEALPNGLHVLIVAVSAALILGLGLQARLEGGSPAASQSVLLVCGLLLLEGALLELSHVLGADFQDDFPAGAFVWTSLLLCGAALYPAVRRNSAICAMVAAIALGIAILAAANWIFGADSQARVPLAAAGALARVRAGVARAARRQPAARRADGDHGRPGDARDRPRRVGRRARRHDRGIRRRRGR